MYKIIGIAFFVACVLIACKKNYLSPPILGGLELPAGNCSINDESSNAFTYQVKGLTQQEALDFFVGNSFFNQNWVQAPSSTTARDGLGPLFNAKSCSACHFKDGRGFPTFEGGLLLRLSVFGGTGQDDEPIYGGQFQNFAISTAQGEGFGSVSYSEVGGTYPDGNNYSLRHPNYFISNLNYGAMNSSVMISPRVGSQMIGLGLLELIPEAILLTHADENDSDGDGISGRPNYVFDPYYSQTLIGRFGWKANASSIPAQVAGAFNGDIGIKTSVHPTENFTAAQASVLAGLPDGGTVEIEDDDFEKVVLYSRTLAVPVRRATDLNSVNRGALLFAELQCIKCHVATYTTGNSGNINALKNVLIHPYTDLLLHDMGDALADNRPDGLANGKEWRTQPLWGLGLIETVNGHSFLLHDGRARSIEEAILWHGGEAQNSTNLFKALSQGKRNDLLNFLKSL